MPSDALVAALAGERNETKGPHGPVVPIALKAFACGLGGGEMPGSQPIKRCARGVLIVPGGRRYASSGMPVSPGELCLWAALMGREVLIAPEKSSPWTKWDYHVR